MTADPSQQNLTKKTLSAFGWQYTSFIAQAVLQLIVLAVLARFLSPEDFGVIGLAMIVIGFANLFSQLGVGPAIIQRSELTPVHIRVGFTLSVILSLIFTILVMAVSPLAAVFLKNDQVTPVLYVISLEFLFTGFGVVAESLLKRNLRFKSLMWASVWSYVFGYALLGILLAWQGLGLWALVWATLCQSLLYSVLVLLFSPHPLIPSFARRETRELLFFGGGFTLAHLFNYGANQGDYFVIGRILGPEPLGIYTRAYQLMMLPAKYFGQVLTVVLFPVMAKLQDKRPQLTKTYLAGISMVTLVSAPLGVLMITAGVEIIEVILGPKWTDTILPFQILSLGVVARGSYKIDDALARALGVMYQRSVRDALYAAAVVLGALIGLRWGLVGVAWGVLGAVLINYLLALQMSKRLLDCSWSQIIKALLPAIYPTITVAVVSTSVRLLMHANDLPVWLILGTTTIMSGLSLIGLYLLRPQLLGFYGTQTLKKILPSLPVQIFPKTVSQWLLAKFNI